MAELPSHIDGYGDVRPFAGAFANLEAVRRTASRIRSVPPGQRKVLPDLAAAIDASGLRNGGTISFHHHLRNGDGVLNAVMEAIASRGLRDLRVAASALFPVHAPLVQHIEAGIVSRICASTIYGPVAHSVMAARLAAPALMYTHGGRARCLESGELHIDVAFVGAPTADTYGNVSGVNGRAACGPLGYAIADVQCADCVIAVTDNLVPYPAFPSDITQDYVDFVVPVPSIGDPTQIVSGTTRPTSDPDALRIASLATRVIESSGLLVDGFSFQAGAGGASLAASAYLKQIMMTRRVQGSFASGGITGSIVEMLDAGLFRALFDVQCLDLAAVDSYRRNEAHQAMSASMYANPHNRGCVANQLDAVILGAAEIDCDFNVNVTTAADGSILGGSGGHADIAAGAKLAIITTRLTAGKFPKIVERVGTVTTPGETVDALVTEEGVAVNPRRSDLADRLRAGGIGVRPIGELLERSVQIAGESGSTSLSRPDGPVVAVVEYRDGTVIDVVRSRTA